MAAKWRALCWTSTFLLLCGILHSIAFAQANDSNASSTPPRVLELNAPPGAPNFDSGSVSFIGNATVLIRYAGFTILTDPNFLRSGDRAYLGFGRSATRLSDPALSFESLPPLDLIVLTQLQGDHFDQLVQEKLDRAMPIVTSPQSAHALSQMGFQAVHALETWRTMTVKKGAAILRITALPSKHGAGIAAKLSSEAMGSMLEFGSAEGRVDYRIYLSGDTIFSEQLREIAQRYPNIDVAMINLGGEKLFGMMRASLDAKQGVELIRLLSPRKAIPIHFDDYDHFKSPLEDFDKLAKAAELQDRIVHLRRGEAYDFKIKAVRQ